MGPLEKQGAIVGEGKRRGDEPTIGISFSGHTQALGRGLLHVQQGWMQTATGILCSRGRYSPPPMRILCPNTVCCPSHPKCCLCGGPCKQTLPVALTSPGMYTLCCCQGPGAALTSMGVTATAKRPGNQMPPIAPPCKHGQAMHMHIPSQENNGLPTLRIKTRSIQTKSNPQSKKKKKLTHTSYSVMLLHINSPPR